MQTKAKIDLKTGVIELEGTEEFVRLQLEKFTSQFQIVVPQSRVPEPNLPIESPQANNQPIAIPKRSSKAPKTLNVKVTKTITKTKRIESIRFDVFKTETVPALENYLLEKKAKSAADIIAVIGYYLTQLKKIESSFSEGHIDYAYRTLGLKGRPKHLRQIIINMKNTKDLFQSEDDGNWSLTRAGEIYVEEKLPARDE